MKLRKKGKTEDPEDPRYWLVTYVDVEAKTEHVIRKLRAIKEGYGHPGLRHPDSDQRLTFTPDA